MRVPDGPAGRGQCGCACHRGEEGAHLVVAFQDSLDLLDVVLRDLAGESGRTWCVPAQQQLGIDLKDIGNFMDDVPVDPADTTLDFVDPAPGLAEAVGEHLLCHSPPSPPMRDLTADRQHIGIAGFPSDSRVRECRAVRIAVTRTQACGWRIVCQDSSAFTIASAAASLACSRPNPIVITKATSPAKLARKNSSNSPSSASNPPRPPPAILRLAHQRR